MALLFDPFSYAKLILCRAEQLGFLAGIFAALATFPSDLVFKLAQESHSNSHHRDTEEPCPVETN